MDVRLSAEQRALREAAVQLAERLGPTSVADLCDAERSAKLDAAVAASSWRDLRTAGEDGLPWASAVEVAVVAEEFGRGLVDAAYVGPVLAGDLRRLTGAPAAASAETILVSPDVGEPGSPSAGAIGFDAAGASAALGPVRGASGFAVESVEVTEAVAVDLTRRIGTVIGGTARTVAAVDEGAVVRWTALGLAMSSADLVGVMRGTLDLAVDYARTRRQYGAPIGSYQAVQHLLADAQVALEGSRSVALHAAWAVDALSPQDALAAAATAKAYCARAARSVCETSIQVHGGIGNTWECLAHVYLRRAISSADLFGGSGPNLRRVLAHRIGAGDGLR